ncbi:hypothetical protein BD770DRAFT_411450 [Pilaira anomala]|nr:hypothetical protein BD770DRAFT_411450 [Pilaira anomala]
MTLYVHLNSASVKIVTHCVIQFDKDVGFPTFGNMLISFMIEKLNTNYDFVINENLNPYVAFTTQETDDPTKAPSYLLNLETRTYKIVILSCSVLYGIVVKKKCESAFYAYRSTKRETEITECETNLKDIKVFSFRNIHNTLYCVNGFKQDYDVSKDNICKKLFSTLLHAALFLLTPNALLHGDKLSDHEKITLHKILCIKIENTVFVEDLVLYKEVMFIIQCAAIYRYSYNTSLNHFKSLIHYSKSTLRWLWITQKGIEENPICTIVTIRYFEKKSWSFRMRRKAFIVLLGGSDIYKTALVTTHASITLVQPNSSHHCRALYGMT